MLLTIIPLEAGDDYDMLFGWGYSRRVVQTGKTPEGSAVKISTLTVHNPDPYDADPYFTAGGAQSNAVQHSLFLQRGNFNSSEQGPYTKMDMDFATDFSLEYFAFGISWLFGYDFPLRDGKISIAPLGNLYYRYFGSHLYSEGIPMNSDEDGHKDTVFLATDSRGNDYLFTMGPNMAGSGAGLGIRFAITENILLSGNVLLTLFESGGGTNDALNTSSYDETGIGFRPYFLNPDHLSVALIDIGILFNIDEFFDDTLLLINYQRVGYPSLAMIEMVYTISFLSKSY